MNLLKLSVLYRESATPINDVWMDTVYYEGYIGDIKVDGKFKELATYDAIDYSGIEYVNLPAEFQFNVNLF